MDVRSMNYMESYQNEESKNKKEDTISMYYLIIIWSLKIIYY
jgi:hypothetical protein